MDSPHGSISSSQEVMESPPTKRAVNLEDSGLGEFDLNDVSRRDPSKAKMVSVINCYCFFLSPGLSFNCLEKKSTRKLIEMFGFLCSVHFSL